MFNFKKSKQVDMHSSISKNEQCTVKQKVTQRTVSRMIINRNKKYTKSLNTGKNKKNVETDFDYYFVHVEFISEVF